MTEESTNSKDKRLCCECGCGQEIPLISKNRGEARRFAIGHNSRGRFNPNWNGGRRLTNGYIEVHLPTHPRATKGGYVLEHVLVMEKMLGRYLMPKEVVHHINGIRTDNRPENLRLFASHSQHMRFHRMKDTSDRFCIMCGGKTVGNRWHRSEFPDVFWCNRCFRRRIRKYSVGVVAISTLNN